jgi:hypothetical protein
MNEPFVIARCINPAYTGTLLMMGRCYAIRQSEIYYGERQVRVYDIPLDEWVAETFFRSEDKVWRMLDKRPNRIYLGEYSIHRFEILHKKPEMDAEIVVRKAEIEFTRHKVGGPEQKP